MPSSKTLFSVLAGAATVAAHGHVNNIVINGASYAGYDVFTLPYQSDPPVVVGWANDATDNGFVAPSAYGTEDIICHKNSENAKGHAAVAAGDSIYLQWDTWPESHKGPVLDYLAACGDSGCESVEKTSLEFFKIGEKGLIDGSSSPGTYAADELLENGIGWLVQIPTNIKPGFYVLRHEIIALHSGGNADGAQNYPQCFNLEITGSGTEVPEGTLGTELYKADDAGILFNIYQTLTTYPIPGPTLIAGATEVEQASSAIASSADPTTGTALATGAAGTEAAATSAAATSAAAAVTTAAEPAVTSAAATSAAAVVTSAAAVDVTTAAPIVIASSTEAAAPAATTTAAAGSGSGSGCSTRRRKRSNRKARAARDASHVAV
ncbi:glycosyl hydrolase family 61-domain-containing protein [Dactylonectria macrodidyma]|uniref:lytic cellulose monooxygenase (C4-dehydrogenating) n=1 Tax=Dactylonectria macrodidyma TaxID=307937 RepID=A0A9P9JK12_9HYPO|nr:glycosyl hydrolase family 61-domain-containing protein [Dactylonectria macrodidyma]